MRLSLALVASATWMVGCRKEEGFEPAVTTMDAPSPSAVIVDPSVGSGSVLIPVRVTNSYGVAVANLTGEVTLSFAGEALDDSTATLALRGSISTLVRSIRSSNSRSPLSVHLPAGSCGTAHGCG